MLFIAGVIIVFLLAYLGVRFFISWTVRKGLLDVPNDRSSHDTPTPKGGGVVIAALTVLSYLAASYLFGRDIVWGFVAGGLMIAVVSWLDDIYSLPDLLRLAVHAAAATVVVADAGWLGSIVLPFGSSDLDLGMLGPPLTILWIVTLINAYNFMDGIDGIAGSQAVIAACAWAVFAMLSGSTALSFTFAAVAAAAAGFLVHNWPPARIFMGDVGSAFLGFTFAAAPLLFTSEAQLSASILPIIAVAVVWPFLFDFVATVLRRMFTVKYFWRPHRSHFYQRLADSGISHVKVTLIYSLLAAFTSACSLMLIYGILELRFLPYVSFIVTAGVVVVMVSRVANKPSQKSRIDRTS